MKFTGLLNTLVRTRGLKRFCVGLPALLAIFCIPSHADTDTHWSNSGTGDWTVDLNWDNHVPSSTVNAHISNAGTAQLMTTGSGSNVYVGESNSGELEISGAGNLTVSNYVEVASVGTGTLSLSTGGKLSDVNGYIGDGYGTGPGTGTVTIDGAGSKWTNTGMLEMDNGSLTIQNGGAAGSSTALIANNSPVNGAVTVTGAGSNWTITNYIYVGTNSNGSLSILNGGTVNDFSSKLGAYDNFQLSNGTVLVDGVGSTWTNTAALIVGDAGIGELTIQNTGTVTAGDVTIGNQSTSTGSVIVSGVGSILSGTGTLTVGYSGNAVVQITNGAKVKAGSLGFVAGPGSTGTGQLVIGIGLDNLAYNAATDQANPTATIPVTITNDADLARGTLTIENEYSPFKGDRATLLTSAGLNGTTFANAADNDFINLWDITYTATDVVATYAGSELEMLPGLTPNQQSVAVGTDAAINNGDLPQLNAALSTLDNSSLPGALDQLSPQALQVLGHVAFDNAAFNSQQLNNHLANLRDGLTGFDGSQMAYSDPSLSAPLSQIKNRLLAWSPNSNSGLMSDSTDLFLGGVDMKDSKAVVASGENDPWSTFIAGNVILADLDYNADLSNQHYTTGAVTAGADYQITSHLRFGAQFAYGHTDANLDYIGSKATVDSYSPGIYASYVDGGWYGNASFNYAYNSDTETRNIQIGPLTGSNHGAAQGNQFGGNLTGGYEFQKDGWKFGPVLGLQYVNLGLDSFNETGPTALQINGQSAESFRSQLGIDARYAVRCGSTVLTPHASASWQHEFLDDSRGITSQFNGSGVGSFTVNTTSPERDSAFLNIGLNAEVTHTLTLFTDYSAQVGQSNFFAQSVQAGLKIGF
jgi:T5SS/PEP-CTERM-associated repeat protein